MQERRQLVAQWQGVGATAGTCPLATRHGPSAVVSLTKSRNTPPENITALFRVQDDGGAGAGAGALERPKKATRQNWATKASPKEAGPNVWTIAVRECSLQL